MTYHSKLINSPTKSCEYYEFRMYDKKQDGLCCHFEAGSYKLSVDDVLVRGNKFDDAAIVVRDSWDPDYLFHAHEFCYDQHPLQQK